MLQAIWSRLGKEVESDSCILPGLDHTHHQHHGHVWMIVVYRNYTTHVFTHSTCTITELKVHVAKMGWANEIWHAPQILLLLEDCSYYNVRNIPNCTCIITYIHMRWQRAHVLYIHIHVHTMYNTSVCNKRPAGSAMYNMLYIRLKINALHIIIC